MLQPEIRKYSNLDLSCQSLLRVVHPIFSGIGSKTLASITKCIISIEFIITPIIYPIYFIQTILFVLYPHGGDEENRTPVRKYRIINIYKFSSLIDVLNRNDNEQSSI